MSTSGCALHIERFQGSVCCSWELEKEEEGNPREGHYSHRPWTARLVVGGMLLPRCKNSEGEGVGNLHPLVRLGTVDMSHLLKIKAFSTVILNNRNDSV